MLTEKQMVDELQQAFELATHRLELEVHPLGAIQRSAARSPRFVAIGATCSVAAAALGIAVWSGDVAPRPPAPRGPEMSTRSPRVALKGPVMKLAGFTIKTPAGSKLSGNRASTADATIRAWLVRGEDPGAAWSDVEQLEIDSHPAEMARVDGDLFLSVTLPALDDSPPPYVLLQGTNTDRETLIAMAESIFDSPPG